MVIRVKTTEELQQLLGRSKPKLEEAKPLVRPWWKKPLLWVLVAYVVGSMTAARGVAELGSLTRRVDLLERQLQYAAENALRAETRLGASAKEIANAMIGLGAKPDCPGECLRYVDPNGEEVIVIFKP